MISAFDNELFKKKCCIAHTLSFVVKNIHDLFIDKIKILDDVRELTKNSSMFFKICETMECPIKKLPSYLETRVNSL